MSVAGRGFVFLGLTSVLVSVGFRSMPEALPRSNRDVEPGALDRELDERGKED
jgi:hypothetical protein